MTMAKGYKVRPSPHKDPKESLRIFLAPAFFQSHNVKAGDIYNVFTSEDLSGPPVGPAIAWDDRSIGSSEAVQTPRSLQIAYALKLDARVYLAPSKKSITNATDVVLREIAQDGSRTLLDIKDENERFVWAHLLQHSLQRAAILVPGLILEDVNGNGPKKSFQIEEINCSDIRELYYYQSNSTIQVVNAIDTDDVVRKLHMLDDSIGGLRKQIKQIDDRVSACFLASEEATVSDPNRRLRSGILLHGAQGTGKTLILEKISEAGGRAVFHIENSFNGQNFEAAKTSLTGIFSGALRRQPSVIIIDDLSLIAPRTEASHTDIGRFLIGQLSRLHNSRTIAVAATRKLSDIDPNLRVAKCFSTEIELPIPDVAARAEILKVLAGTSKSRPHPSLDFLASRSHGCVGTDLEKVYEMYMDLIDETRREESGPTGQEGSATTSTQDGLLESDKRLKEILGRIRPSAMQEIFVETPNVTWDDIGGQHEVKQVLDEAIVLPVKYPEDISEHGCRPEKGVLLYGPPGCSKTMTAKAAARESGLNFIAVKGPELTSMYVGESERALREVFSKARAVKPSIIFFDEIDAIGTRNDSGQTGGIQTVTTLLNELDGFDDLEGVFVLAETNKPELLDPALIRSGRLTTPIYVGLPDAIARREILRKKMLTMLTDEDIDENALVKSTDGFSGAEVVEICEKARWEAVKAQIASQRRQLVKMKYFQNALGRVQKSVTDDMVEKFRAWGAARH